MESNMTYAKIAAQFSSKRKVYTDHPSPELLAELQALDKQLKRMDAQVGQSLKRSQFGNYPGKL